MQGVLILYGGKMGELSKEQILILADAKRLREEFEEAFETKLTTKGEVKFVKYRCEYSFDEIYKAITTAATQYDDALEALFKIKGILKNWRDLKREYFKEE